MIRLSTTIAPAAEAKLEEGPPPGVPRFLPLLKGPEACGLLSEHLLPLNDVASLVPTLAGKKVSKVTLWRWGTKGLGNPRDRQGPRIKLATAKLGLVRYTSYEALLRFSAELDGCRVEDLVAATRAAIDPQQQAAHKVRQAQAEKMLKEAGWMK